MFRIRISRPIMDWMKPAALVRPFTARRVASSPPKELTQILAEARSFAAFTLVSVTEASTRGSFTSPRMIRVLTLSRMRLSTLLRRISFIVLRLSQLLGDFLHLEDLEDIAHLHVGVVLQTHTAFKAFPDFFGIVLETLQ